MAGQLKLRQFKAIIFDVYATLVDWENGIYSRLESLLQRASGKTSQWTRRDALLAFTEVEGELQTQHPEMLYADLLGVTYEHLAKRLNVPVTSEEVTSFGQSIKHWPVFPDTVAALGVLSKHYKLTILSNVDRTSFSHTRAQLEHGFTFDLVMTAQDIGTYKPNLANYQYALREIEEKFGIKKEEVLVVAQSLTHDHIPANTLGIATTWIEREGAIMGLNDDATYIFHYKSLGEMAAVLEAESTS